MRIKSHLYSIVLPLLILTPFPIAFAAPTACPGIQAITSVGVNLAVSNPQGPNEWLVSQTGSVYDTNQTWSLSLNSVHANSKEEALAAAKNSLPTLRLIAGPLFSGPPANSWICLYKNSGFVSAFTITPPLSFIGKSN